MASNLSPAPENTSLATGPWDESLYQLSAVKEQKIDGGHYNPTKC